MVTTYDEFNEETMEYLHIFDYYDKPLFFVTRECNELQLYRFINDDNEIFKYFNAVITEDELKKLLHKEIGVKEILTQLIQAQRMDYLLIDNCNQTINRLRVPDIQDNELPIINHCIKTIDSTTAPIKH